MPYTYDKKIIPDRVLCYLNRRIIPTFAPVRVYMPNQTIASFLKEHRRKLKMTQPELARRAGVGLRFIRELESGKPTVQMDKVNKVIRLFGFELGLVRIDFEEIIRNIEKQEQERDRLAEVEEPEHSGQKLSRLHIHLDYKKP